MQHDYRYVTRKEANRVRNDLIRLINEVQDQVREYFTFQYYFVGSSARNMVTYNAKGNQGYDFDVNFEIHDEDENYTAAEIKNILRQIIDRIAWRYGYDFCEDSTRVLTIKFKDRTHARVVHSCDIAIVNNYVDDAGKERQEYIRYNKAQRSYYWEEQRGGHYHLEKKIRWLKKNDLWNELLDYYIEKKDKNADPDKPSRALYAEAVHDVCKRNGYNGR